MWSVLTLRENGELGPLVVAVEMATELCGHALGQRGHLAFGLWCAVPIPLLVVTGGRWPWPQLWAQLGTRFSLLGLVPAIVGSATFWMTRSVSQRA